MSLGRRLIVIEALFRSCFLLPSREAAFAPTWIQRIQDFESASELVHQTHVETHWVAKRNVLTLNLSSQRATPSALSQMCAPTTTIN